MVKVFVAYCVGYFVSEPVKTALIVPIWFKFPLYTENPEAAETKLNVVREFVAVPNEVVTE